MRKVWLIAALMGSLAAIPAEARQDSSADKAERPLTDKDPNLVDAAKTPLNDLNIDKRDIPQTLTDAIAQPYTLDGLKGCRKLTSAITELDAILGPDIEMPQDDNDRISSGRVAKWMVSKFIPFRGLIREISGANSQEAQVRTAIQAGVARRAFLKGVGQARGCKYPARPASVAMIEARKAEIAAEKTKSEKSDDKTVAVAEQSK